MKSPTSIAAASTTPATSLACAATTDAGAPTDAGASAATTGTVMIRQFTYRPDALMVPVGTTVSWTNLDLVAHTVTSDTGLFDSGLLQNRGTCAITFTTPGTFAYHCTIHPAMVATIEVT